MGVYSSKGTLGTRERQSSQDYVSGEVGGTLPSLISLMASADVKHHVTTTTATAEKIPWFSYSRCHFPMKVVHSQQSCLETKGMFYQTWRCWEGGGAREKVG